MGEAEGLEPHSLAKAKLSPDWLFWEKATLEELKTLVGSKWVFRVKKDAAAEDVGGSWYMGACGPSCWC